MDKRFKRFKGDIFQCQECGYAKASGEEQIHGAFHRAYEKCRAEYGVNILPYSELLDTQSKIAELRGQMKNKNIASLVLPMIYAVEFTKSLRQCDYHKVHPKFEDYVMLLWNTPMFLNDMQKCLSGEVFDDLKIANRANRHIAGETLVCFKVEETKYATAKGVKDLSFVDKILVLEVEDEDINTTVEAEELEKAAGKEAETFDIIELLSRAFGDKKTA